MNDIGKLKVKAIEGWMTPAELAWLYRRGIENRMIVEVGSWKGRSTYALAASGAKVIAVDTWEGVPHDPATQRDYYAEAAADSDAVYQEFLDNTRGLNVTAMRMSSHAAAALLMVEYGPVFDVVFIDADHAYDAVRDDILAYRPLLRPGGLLCGHDYERGCSGVIRAVDELLPGATIGPDSIWSIRL